MGDLLPPTLGPPAVDQPHVASHRHDVVAGPRLAPHSPHRRHSLPAGDRLGTPPQRGPEVFESAVAADPPLPFPCRGGVGGLSDTHAGRGTAVVPSHR